MKSCLSKVSTALLQHELNMRNNSLSQVNEKYGKILKELQKKFKALEKGEKVTISFGDVKAICKIYLYDDVSYVDLEKVTCNVSTAENDLIKRALDEYLTENSEELNRLPEIRKGCDKIDDDFKEIMAACKKIGKEFNMDELDIFEGYVV